MWSRYLNSVSARWELLQCAKQPLPQLRFLCYTMRGTDCRWVGKMAVILTVGDNSMSQKHDSESSWG